MKRIFVLHQIKPTVTGDWLPPDSSCFLAAWADPQVGLAYCILTPPDEAVVVVAKPLGKTVEESTAYEAREALVLSKLVLPHLRFMLNEPDIKLFIVPAWSSRAQAEAALALRAEPHDPEERGC